MVPTINTSIYEVIFVNTYSYPKDNKMAPVIPVGLSVDSHACYGPSGACKAGM